MRRDLIGETLLNQFRVESYVASGGMATIFRVWDLQRSVPLAMKLLHIDLAADPAFMARFEREAASLQRLSHPHIVPFYGLYRTDDLTFLLERYVDGPSLDEVLRRRAGKPMPMVDALVYFKALYTSLGYAHAQGIIHCDVKPGNVLIDQGGHVTLTDFGIARYMDAATTTSSAMGTPLYMAPEQIRGERVTPQTDIYSLGVLMYELLTGQRPFKGLSEDDIPPGVGDNPSDRVRYQQLYTPPPDPRALNSAIPPALGAAVMRAMAKNPAERYPSVAAMADAVSQAVGARFDTLPDRVRLNEEMVYPPNPAWQTTVPEAAAAGVEVNPGAMEEPDPPFNPAWEAQPAPEQTLPGQPPPYRPAPRAIHEGAQPPGSRRPGVLTGRLLALLGVLVLLTICAVAAVQGLRRMQQGGLGAVPPNLPGSAVTRTSRPTATDPKNTPVPTDQNNPAPTNKPAPTSTPANLSDFPVSGDIAVIRRDQAVTMLYLLNAQSGELARQPFVVNVGPHPSQSPAWSPDGAKLTWVAQYKGRPHVVVMDLTEGEPYQLAAGEKYSRVSAPAFLPDGQRVSFWGLSGSQNYMVIADVTTGEAVQEVELPEYRNMFTWTPDNRVAYIRPRGNAYEVVVGDAADGTGTPVDPQGFQYAPAWSKDGSWLAFQSDQGRDSGMDEIWVVRPDGSELHPVTSTPADAWSRAPSWSPDGKMITFVSNRAGSQGNDLGELFVVNLESGEIRQMTNTGGAIYDWRPAWRP